MAYLFARAAAFPGVGEATATTSVSSDAILKDAAWISASNCEPMMPTFTLPSLDMFPLSNRRGFSRICQAASVGMDVSGVASAATTQKVDALFMRSFRKTLECVTRKLDG